ncbi:MAG TPA: HemK family protein methyltransferase, partial [Acidimicrobiales bacterium]
GCPRVIDRAALVERLEVAGCVAAGEEADELLAAVPDAATLEAWVRRREQGEPLAWITGTTWFCGRPLAVDAGLYVPRYQTEELATRAAAHLPAGGRAADLCTGTGAVAAHLAASVPGAAVVGVDVDPRAAACARRNRVPVVVGDLAGPPLRPGAFDLVTAVAPYVPTDALGLLPADVQRYEPRRALDGGADGLDLVRRVVAAAAGLLRPGGRLLLELGGDQDAALAPALAAAGFEPAEPWHDEDGDLRGIATRRRDPVTRSV